jgi:Zn-dependent M28 family amino/carboxypeptidase
LHPARRDSINNGADDDGSGSVVLLEIAEAMMNGSRPKRSVLFVWHASEEDGLLGSRYFTDHPTVPRDSIVAQLNTDMLGRAARAITRSAVQVSAHDRLASPVEGARRHRRARECPAQLQLRSRLQLRRPGHPMNSYCRSDHYNYARYGIPIAYMGTSTQATTTW